MDKQKEAMALRKDLVYYGVGTIISVLVFIGMVKLNEGIEQVHPLMAIFTMAAVAFALFFMVKIFQTLKERSPNTVNLLGKIAFIPIAISFVFFLLLLVFLFRALTL